MIVIIIASILFAFILLSAAILLFVIPRKSKTPGVAIIRALFIAHSIYNLGYAFELVSTSAADKLFFNHFQYFGIVFIALLWFMLAVQFKNRSYRWTVKKLMPFLIIPIVTLILNLIHTQNGLLYTSYEVVVWNNMSLLTMRKGVWYYINAVYQNALVIGTIIIYFKTAKRVLGIEKKQAHLLLTLSLICFIITISTFFTGSTSYIDYGPIVISLFSFVFLSILFRYELFELLPFAYYNVFEAADYPIMILSDTLSIVKANRIAQTYFGDMIKGKYYVPLNEVFAAYPEFKDVLVKQGKYSFKKVNSNEEYYFVAKLTKLDARNRRMHGDLGYLLIFTNETSHIKRIRNLEVESSIDPLTGSYNRRYFYKIAEYTAEKARLEGNPLSFIMFDIDNFKKVNDKYGHQAGDHVLASLAGVIRSQLRESDIFTRFGGEEFIVLLPSTKPEAAYIIANRICGAVRNANIEYNATTFQLTISGGVTGSETIRLSIDDYIALADKALYKAKESGRDKVFLMPEPDAM
ncbi:MAG: histidine kinase N-terminal 7TM domain-containing diguanylate cyclase [Christensenellales bacterium]